MRYRLRMCVDQGINALASQMISRVAKSVYYFVFRVVLYLRCCYTDFAERFLRPTDVSVPPAILRYKVSESTDARSFLDIGMRTAIAIEHALGDAGSSLNAMGKVLDFGCGCGRTLRWLIDQSPHTTFIGTDVDMMSVRWCQQYLDVDAYVNGDLPPLVFSDMAIDCVIAISVFTHLSEQNQLLWLEELRRILRPGGLLVVSLHGQGALGCLGTEDRITLQAHGVLFKRSSKLHGIHPAWYHTTFHTEEYVMRTWTKLFKVVAYRTLGLGYQDLVVLQREELE